MFRPPHFPLSSLRGPEDALLFIDYVRHALGTVLYQGFDFRCQVDAGHVAGGHLYTLAEADEGNRLLEEAVGLFGGDEAFDDAVFDRDVFNTPKFAKRHLSGMGDVLDLAAYLRFELRFEPRRTPHAGRGRVNDGLPTVNVVEPLFFPGGRVYFPMQKCANISPSTSLEVTSPVMSARWCAHSLSAGVRRSAERPASSPFSASRSAWRALSSAR